MNKKTYSLLGLIFSVLLYSNTVFAQDSQATPEITAQTDITLTPVVVTGTRTEELVTDVPATMEVFTQEDIKKVNAKNPRDILERAFNIEVNGVHGGGLSLRGMHDDHVAILVDGRRPAGAGTPGEINGQIMRTLNAANIERVEIVRGPAGALYGSNAIAGVINIITKKSAEREVTIGMTGGNYGTNNYASIDFGKIGKWDAILSGQFANFYGAQRDMYATNGWEKPNTGFNVNANANIGYSFNDNHELRLFADISDEYNHKESYGFDPMMGGTRTKNYVDRLRYSTALVYSGSVDDHSYKFTGSFSQTRDKNREQNTGHSNYTNVYTSYAFEAQDTWFINDYNTLTVGIEVKTDSIDSKSITGTNNQTRFAIYAQNEISLFDDTLRIIPAARFDSYDTYGSSFTPSIGLVWEFIEGHRIKANYGFGFRAPELMDLYGEQQLGFGTALPNPDLKPERSQSFDIRYEGRYKNISGSIGYFQTEIQDYMDFEFIRLPGPGGPGEAIKNNISKARIRGVEADLSVHFLEHFTATIQYAHNDAMNLTDDKRLINSAKNTYSLSLDYNYKPWDLKASIWGKFYDDFYTFEDKTIDFHKVGFSLSKTWEEKYTLSFNINNILSSYQNAGNETYLSPVEWSLGFEMKL